MNVGFDVEEEVPVMVSTLENVASMLHFRWFFTFADTFIFGDACIGIGMVCMCLHTRTRVY